MAISNITATTPRVQYSAAAAQTDFIYPFPIFVDSDLFVYRTPAGNTANDSVDLLTLNVDYTVSGAGVAGGGIVTLLVAATAGDIITMQRKRAVQRTSQYDDGQAITGSELNQDFNSIVMMLQDQLVYITNIIAKYQDSAVIEESQTELPELPQNFIFKGGPNNSILAVEPEENPDCSTLRSELADNATPNGAGANMVGYFDGTLGSTTVRDKLDSLSGSVAPQNSILDFGGDNTGILDNTPAFNAALVYYAANPDNAFLYFPPGDYLFNSQPNEVEINLNIIGHGTNTTRLIRNYIEAVPGAALIYCGAVSFAQLQISDLTVFAAAGTTGGAGIRYGSDVAFSSVVPTLKNVRVLGEGTFSYGVIADGSANVNGIQQVNFDYLYIANTTVADIFFSQVAEGFVNAIVGGIVEVTGSPAFKSSYLQFNLSSNSSGASSLVLDEVRNSTFKLTTFASCINTANSTDITIFGDVTSKQRNSTTLEYIGFSDFQNGLFASGFQKLPGGLIMQWVSNAPITSASSAAPTIINLPVPFTTTNFGVFGHIDLSTTGTYEGIRESPVARNLSQVGIYRVGISASVINFFVLGY